MSVTKSRKHIIDGKSYFFTFDKDKNLNGISQTAGRNGQYRETPLDPSSAEFATIAASDEALNAYNVNKFKGKATVDTIEKASVEELNKVYNDKTKKRTNEDIDLPLNETNSSRNIATEENFGVGDPFTGYKASKRKKTYPTVFAYPLDIDPQQDHLKIKKFKYSRPASNVQAGRPDNVKTETKSIKTYKKGRGTRTSGTKTVNTNVSGDSVLGMEQLGSVVLPMPKVVDTNGCEWGESKVNIFGLAAMSMGQNLGKLGMSEEQQEDLKKIQKSLKKNKGMGTSSLRDIAGATGASVFSQAAITALGQQISNNEFLARTGGRILNPNAELLFQGPVLRDFNFDFLMVARSREEGEEIRRIIRWFKTGMAPKFNNSTFLNNPDIFTLEYKRGQGPMDQLDTVNRFSPGGLALRTIQVDYAPNGSWSAYQDSQPVALRMSLNFAELRPIFESDQEMTPASSVGY